MSGLEWPATVTVSKRAKLDFDEIVDLAMRDKVLAALANNLRPVPNPPKIVGVHTSCWPKALLLTVPDPDFWHLYYYQVIEDGHDPAQDDQADDDDDDDIVDDYLVLYRNLTTQELEDATRLGRPLVRYRVARILPRSQFSVPFPQF